MFEDSGVVWLGVDIVMLLLCGCFGFFESGILKDRKMREKG